VLAGAGEVRAVGRTLNLHEALGAAADGTDLLAHGGAAAPRTTVFAKRANH